MSLNPEQITELAKPLDRSKVASRQQAGQTLSYIEGWHAIAEANRIFGFDGWERHTIEIRQLGEPYEVNGKMRVNYSARVRIIAGDVIRDGCGFGQGIDKDVGQAHESALKEAETDAMKRALMTFGNPFGLALYDKSQANVCTAPVETPDPTSPIPDKTRDWLQAQINAKHIPVGTVCQQFSVTSLKALTFGQVAEVVAWLKEQKVAA